MSKVLNALDRSEQQHLQYQPGNVGRGLSRDAGETGPSRTKIAAAMFLPALLIAGWSLNDFYQQQYQSWMSQRQPEPESVEVAVDYQLLPYPQFDNLLPTYQLAPPVTSSQPVKEAVKAKPAAGNASANGLQDIDLSGLSPELAQRVESVLEDSQPAETSSEPASQSALNLATQGAGLRGKLPAMNFQTHVYSSNENKRWVKINGVEYSQGDRISADVELVAIEPRACLIRYAGQLIQVPALYDWRG
ncbi:general secretion pathway protein GspB [Vibrio sp.]|uniref:general secretion pathway protein GspB n=1 Tax=Vibrio sp. TaxID=678 RepID=UPI003D1507A8